MLGEMDIEIPRNGDYFMGWTLEDDTGIPLDITGWALKLDVRPTAGSGAVVTSAEFSGRDDVNGFFNILLRGANFSSVQGDMERVKLAYDFLATDSTGIRVVELRGHIHLAPGVTF